MIKVHCRTICSLLLDDYKREEWPEEFCCRPMLGDSVDSKSGARLWIVAITHSLRKSWDNKALAGGINYEPILIIELCNRGLVN